MRKTLGLSLVFLCLFLSCSMYKKEAKLAPEEREFLSAVRFIITKQEKATYLDLPSSDRPAFIEEFWRKRDTDTDTEVNEYKNEYLKRVEEAKRLFRGEGGPSGWLQDRGRVYVLLGPPEQRETYPRGDNLYGPPKEYWHYGFHILTFVDNRWNGNYELQEGPRMLAEISVAQKELNPDLRTDSSLFDFNLEVKDGSGGERIFLVSIPYENIAVSAEGDELRATLELTLEILDSSGKKVHQETRNYPISLDQKKLKELMGEDYRIEVPVRLDPGTYRASMTLKSSADQAVVKKNIVVTV
jgi:GWxTD domain-containing protein